MLKEEVYMFYPILYFVGFLLSVLTTYALYKVRRSDVGYVLTIMTILTSFWLVMEGLSYGVGSPEQVVLLQKLKYVSIIFIPPILIFTAYTFVWKLDRNSMLKLSPIFIIPIFSLISITTNVMPYPFISNTDAYMDGDVMLFIYDRNVGFYIHVIYSYLLMMANNILLLYRVIKVPKVYKIQSFFVFIGSLTTMVVNVFFVFGLISNIPIDTTPFSVLITIMIYYWGIYTLPVRGIVPHARNLVIENMSDLVIIVDNHNQIIDVNPTAYQLLLNGTSMFEDDKSRRIDFRGIDFSKLADSLPIKNREDFELETLDHQIIEIEFNKKILHYQGNVDPIYDSDNIQIGTLYIFYDITDIQKNIYELTSLNNDLIISDTIINDALEGIVITNAKNEIIKVNKSMEVISGYSAEELIGSNPNKLKSDHHDFAFYREMWDAITEKGFWEGEIWDQRKNGEEYPKWMSITVIRDTMDNITHYIGISSDISKMKKAEKDIHTMAYYDQLTGLPNRTLFNDRLKTALMRRKRSKKSLAILYLDLGRFKLVNDTFGHHVGDELLIAFSKRIQEIIRKSDTFCRLGGDEFTVILEGLNNGDQARHVAKNIINEVARPFMIGDNEITITLSIGISVAPEDDTEAEGLIRKADAAMYHAKEMGGSRYTFSSEELEKHNREINILEVKLRSAIENDEFELYLQPQIGKQDGNLILTGAEALLRWPQKDGSMIPPFKFIGLSEKNGLINPIGLWVLEEVFRINERLRQAGISINIALNVSIRQFENEDFFIRLKELIHDDISLSVEITESLFFNDLTTAIEKLEEIKSLGIKIALDDFGTGFSSMSYLNRLPIDYLKIDKSFIDQIEPGSNKNLAYMILSMAKTLELQTIAEGIEHKEQSDALFNEGCDIIQGYYYGKPMREKDFVKFADEYEHD